MTNFTIEYLNPCEKDPSTVTLSREREIVSKFKAIDWFQHALDVVYSHNPPDAGVEYNDALHDYYYFSVEYKDYQEHLHTFNVVAALNNGYADSKDDILFDIEYRRPKHIAISRLAQLFGKMKEKLNPEYMSHGKGFTLHETAELMGQFIRFEKASVDAALNIEGYLFG